ncbi:hypothetical protein MIMGU_mgv1a015226mg [Erythranthe guttata]|uniref:Uncharacterized protein n=1 Tax=Erythranthe guttata TaxID=4155 RepID=A0A022R052_ERYGU|nr:hypothetical protein MIMGU_mgv1a015226mg [Erythranthe guttata]
MKVIKSMKKLKFWSRKKKNKFLLTESPPPPSRPPPPPPRPYPPIHSQYEPLLPSAPPLPPWLEYDLQFQESDEEPNSPNSANNSHSHFSPTQEEIYFDDHEICHQEIQNPIYDDAIVPKIEKLKRGGGAFGCVVGFGVHLVRCVFPCFHIREVVGSNKGNCITS